MDAPEFASSTENDMEKHHISYSTVETDSLSTCLAVLLHGTIRKKPFCFILHTSKVDEVEDEDLNDLLVYLLEKLAVNLKQDLNIRSLASKKDSINNLRLLIAGGVIEKHQLTRQAFNLLNTNIDINLIRGYTNDNDAIYLFEKLQNNVVLIKPVTYLDSDENEAKGERGETVFIPPNVALKYNCINNTAMLSIQWQGTCGSVNLALMHIKDLTSNDIEQFKWHWEKQQIDLMNNKLASDQTELNAFKCITDFVFTTINSYAIVSEKPLNMDFDMSDYIQQSFECINYIKRDVLGFGYVCKVRSKNDNQLFVIKKLSTKFYDKEYREKKLKEIEIYRLLCDQKHIVKLMNSWEDFYNLYIQTEYCPTNLFDYAKHHEITQLMICFYLNQISQALNFMHSLAYAHMNVKVENILITSNGILKLCNFNMIYQLNYVPKDDFSGHDLLAPCSNIILITTDVFNLGLVAFQLLDNSKTDLSQNIFNVANILNFTQAFNEEYHTTVTSLLNEFPIDGELQHLLYQILHQNYKQRPSPRERYQFTYAYKPALVKAHDAGIYATPSITYAAHPRYSEVKLIESSTRKKFFKSGKYVQFVLECRVHPSNIVKVDEETLGAGNTTIDPNINNAIIEWVINHNGKSIVDFNDPDSSIVCTGILTRVTDEHPGLLPESEWWYKSHLCRRKECCMLAIDRDSLDKEKQRGYTCNILFSD